MPAILSYGFRPFFLAGALYAALAIPLWLAMLFLGGMPTGAFVGPAWHAHEMIFGFLSAVVAGFVLTAVPNWTGRLPISGMPLLVLLCAWLAGRAVAYLPLVPPAAAIVDLLFPFLLAAAIWREVLVGKNHKNVPIAVLISLFGAANLLDYLGIQFTSLSGYGVRLALGTAATLIALVGGRITPSFTRNWMARGQMQPLPAPTDRLDTLALTVTATASLVWVLIPDELATGVLLIAAAALLLLRLARWRGWRTLRSPIVAVLHLGYLWLAVALLLNGLAIIFPDTIPVSAGIHSLTAGAIGTMTLAVMTRASLGHTGRAIETDVATATIYGLVTVGALLRVCAPFLSDGYATTLLAAGAAWSAAFALFALRYGPMLLRPRPGGA